MDLHNFLSFLNFVFLLHLKLILQSIYSNSPGRLRARRTEENSSVPLALNLSSDYQIFQAFFPRYVLDKFHLSLSGVKYKKPFVSIFCLINANVN